MNAPPLASSVRWEESLLTFLRDALAPSRARWRSSLRLTLLCVLGTLLVMAFHIPDGEFLIIFFFAVSQPDAWASYRKARLRGIGTLLGGGLALACILAGADKPGLIMVTQAVLFALALFLSRTTTVPYAVILAMFTFVIATSDLTTSPEASLQIVFWRILLTLTGAVLGTVAQLVLWPEKPEQMLLQGLGDGLQTAERMLQRWLDGDPTQPRRSDAWSNSPVALASTIANQLDLLASVEAGSPSLRRRHPEQLKLITDIELIVGAARRLERTTGDPLAETVDATAVRERVRHLCRELARLREALVAGRPPAPAAVGSFPTARVETDSPPVLSAVAELEGALQQLPESMAFLADRTADVEGFEAFREPLVRQSILTPACRLSNVEAVRFGLKGALAATLCYIIYQALDWPGISTSVVTALICAQSSFGAVLQKSVLRLAGAAFGGLLAVLAVVAILPNLESVASFLVLMGGLFFVAAWLTTGNSRISYIGLQTGLVLSLVLLNETGPTVDLIPAGDRIVGVFLGITVMGVIDLNLWPNFAGPALRRKLAETLRALAEMPRHATHQEWDRAGAAALAVHQHLATALNLYREWQLEFGSPAVESEAERHRLVAVGRRIGEVFLALLAVLHHRQAMQPEALPDGWRQPLQALDEELARVLETLAAPSPAIPGGVTDHLDRLLAALPAGPSLSSAGAETGLPAPSASDLHWASCRELVTALKRLEIDLRAAAPNEPSPIKTLVASEPATT